MKGIDFEELHRAASWGGWLGLVVLIPASLCLTVAALFGDQITFGMVGAHGLARLVRLGLELFLMGGWGFAAASLVRQLGARTVGNPIGVLAGAATGTLVINLMGVIFLWFVPDAPPIGWVALLGLLASLLVSAQLGYGPKPLKPAKVAFRR